MDRALASAGAQKKKKKKKKQVLAGRGPHARRPGETTGVGRLPPGLRFGKNRQGGSGAQLSLSVMRTKRSGRGRNCYLWASNRRAGLHSAARLRKKRAKRADGAAIFSRLGFGKDSARRL